MIRSTVRTCSNANSGLSRSISDVRRMLALNLVRRPSLRTLQAGARVGHRRHHLWTRSGLSTYVSPTESSLLLTMHVRLKPASGSNRGPENGSLSGANMSQKFRSVTQSRVVTFHSERAPLWVGRCGREDDDELGDTKISCASSVCSR